MADFISKADGPAFDAMNEALQSVRCYCAFGAAQRAATDRDTGKQAELDALLDLWAQSTTVQDCTVDPLALFLCHERTSACDEANNEAMAAVLDLAQLLGKIVAGRQRDEDLSDGSTDVA